MIEWFELSPAFDGTRDDPGLGVVILAGAAPRRP